MAKTIYHSELVKLGAINVRIKSDVTPSKFKDKSPYCTLEINGEERNYTIESQACADVLHANKGRLVMVEAAGSREEATIKVLAAGAVQEPAAAPAARQPIQVPAAQASAAVAPAASPHGQAQNRRTPRGQAVGNALNNACASLTAQGAELNPRRVFEIASDIIRMSYYLEEGHLAPTHEARLKAEAVAKQPGAPQAPAPKQPSQIPPAEPPEPETDEVPF